MNTTQEVAKALWATRQPDDIFQPCNWVRVYTWRHDEAVIIITELETPKKIERRLDGWVIKDGKSWRLESLCEYQWDKIELACSKMGWVASTKEGYSLEEQMAHYPDPPQEPKEEAVLSKDYIDILLSQLDEGYRTATSLIENLRSWSQKCEMEELKKAAQPPKHQQAHQEAQERGDFDPWRPTKDAPNHLGDGV